jgi:hypothetical protein
MEQSEVQKQLCVCLSVLYWQNQLLKNNKMK